MIGVAVVAIVLGSLVIHKRINTPSAESQQAADAANQDQQAAATPDPAPVASPDTSTVGWQVYNNTKYNFSLMYPPNLQSGTVSSNSALGTYSAPIKGFHVGPLVLVALKTADLKKSASDYFNSSYQAALHPQAGGASDTGAATACKIDTINNPNAQVKSVSCTGEGGAERYAYITGTSYDIFVDGYTKGYDQADFGSFAKDTDYSNILASFKFSLAAADTTQTTATNPTPTPSPTPNPNPTPSPTPAVTSPIQSFTIAADDSGATPSQISVPAGTIVEITFNVASTNVYYGGLDFRSSVVNSGTVHSGESKTISFTATKSFAFTPYWPASQVAKNYTINVTVQ